MAHTGCLPFLLIGKPSKLDESWRIAVNNRPPLCFVGTLAANGEGEGWRAAVLPGPMVVAVDFCLSIPRALSILTVLRADRPDVYCLALVDTQEQHRAASKAGVHAVLLKGFRMDELSATFERCLASMASTLSAE
jgi:DNA-binding NarL/FixJ family response regulator